MSEDTWGVGLEVVRPKADFVSMVDSRIGYIHSGEDNCLTYVSFVPADEMVHNITIEKVMETLITSLYEKYSFLEDLPDWEIYRRLLVEFPYKILTPDGYEIRLILEGLFPILKEDNPWK
jgi:hypothetical protein